MSIREEKAWRSPAGSIIDPNRLKGKYEGAAESLLGEALQHRITSETTRNKRSGQIVKLYVDTGWSMQDIGMAFDISRERVRQILRANKAEVRPKFSGSQKKMPG